MRKLFFFLLTLFLTSLTSLAQNEEINWLSMNDAIVAQAKEPKKIIMDVYTHWCGPCKMLDRNTFHNPDVVQYINDHYYAVQFNAEGDESIDYKEEKFYNPNYDASRAGRNSQHQFAVALSITAYPTIVFFYENGEMLMPLSGYKSPTELELYLKLFLNDRHKNISTKEEWRQYQKEFKSEFKG